MQIQINPYQNYQKQNLKKISFRGFDEAVDIWDESKPTIQEALKATGNKNIAALMHGNSFPSRPDEDFSIGSPYSGGALDFKRFWGGIIDKVVLGPWGATKKEYRYSLEKTFQGRHSPYNSTRASLNPFFINYKYLTTPEGENLLTEETHAEVVKNNPAQGTSRVNYDYVEKSSARMLDEAFKNYQTRLEQDDNFSIELSNKISAFRKENDDIFMDAVFDVISDEYGVDNFKRWSELDKKLPVLLSQNDDTAKERLTSLYKTHKNRIDKYMFSQYLAEDHKKLAPFKYVADQQVAMGRAYEWQRQDLILYEIDGRKLSLGVPGDMFSPKGRNWNMPIFDPHKLFDEQGNLTEGGKIVKEDYRKIFRKNKDGLRIDHSQGLADPHVCVDGSADVEDGASRLLSAPNHPLFGKYSIISDENIDHSKHYCSPRRVKNLTSEQIDRYALFMEKIILQAAKEEGLDKSHLMLENLGTITRPADAVNAKLNLGGMVPLTFVDVNDESSRYRGKNSAPNDYISTGTHDGQPFVDFFNNMSDEKYRRHIDMLTTDLGIEDQRERFYVDRTEGMKLKFAELFASPAENVQIFFTHLLGLNGWYNKPGDRSVEKWSLRVPNDFIRVYFKNLVEGTAFNPFDAFSKALEANKEKQTEFKPLVQKLRQFETELKNELKTCRL